LAWAADCDRLRDVLTDVQGAKLLLLDLRRGADGPAGRGPVPRWERTAAPPIGAIRHVWLTRGPTPEDARLLRGLEVALAQSGLFKEVQARIGRWTEDLRERKKQPVLTWYFPGVLDGLELSRKAMAP
jgi:hypothetical protein